MKTDNAPAAAILPTGPIRRYLRAYRHWHHELERPDKGEHKQWITSLADRLGYIVRNHDEQPKQPNVTSFPELMPRIKENGYPGSQIGIQVSSSCDVEA